MKTLMKEYHNKEDCLNTNQQEQQNDLSTTNIVVYNDLEIFDDHIH